ncbi:GAF domain-containing protein [Frankia sp. CiP3]|uniref:GAF domain-containing protein n=1 Tax=Frankia sp. CiP3 TaxID=2880971 RepID=UPI001EF5BA89|nr:GAF domain-containing protein [Frankia sp. CiP3]
MNAAGLRDQEFETFYRQQSAALTRWLTARGACPADAADAAQEALTQVWLRWPHITSHRSYLYRTAGREMARIWQARQDVRFRADTRPSTVEAGGMPTRLDEGLVRQQLLTLPARQRAVLAGYYDGYRDAELAPVLGMAAATIRSDRRHARAGLRALTALLEQDPHGLMLRRAYADMRDGDPRPTGARLLIARSWSRSALHLADPRLSPALPPLTDYELTQRRATSPLAGISPDAWSTVASRTGLLTVITDADGRVLWRAGDRKVLRRGEEDGHGDGACLAEHTVGTSGVSLTLAVGHPVVVSGPEHYCPAQHDLVCAGAPLRHPADGQLLGTICISAPWRAAHPDMLKLIDQTATRIRQQLKTCPAPPGSPPPTAPHRSNRYREPAR